MNAGHVSDTMPVAITGIEYQGTRPFFFKCFEKVYCLYGSWNILHVFALAGMPGEVYKTLATIIQIHTLNFLVC